MKTVFICIGPLSVLLAGACTQLEVEDESSSGSMASGEDGMGDGDGDGDGEGGGDGDGDGDGEGGSEDDGAESSEDGGPDLAHHFEGEAILFVNARLTDEQGAFQTHLALEEEGTFLGNALYLYQPQRECDDGGSDCRLTSLGNLRLDHSLGEISVGDGSLKRFVLRDIAWHPERGLWGATYDSNNDEWGIATLGVPHWRQTGNAIAVQRYAIQPGHPESPSTDPCYWYESISGLDFVGNDLLVGMRGAGSKGLISDGMLFRVNTDLIQEQGHCVDASDISQDPEYYACGVLCEPWCSFGENIGVAGDIVATPEGDRALAWIRSEDEDSMPLDRNALYRCSPPANEGDMTLAEDADTYLEEVRRGDEIDGLARIGDKLYGLSVFGIVYEIDNDARTVTEVDDLSSFFPENGLRLRGATRVDLDALDD